MRLQSPTGLNVDFQRSALIVGHPGHLYQVYGWLEEIKPRVYIITDGSGRLGLSKPGPIDNTLRKAGAKRGIVFMRYTDLQIYDAIIHQDFGLFLGLVKEIADELVREKVKFVFGDAAEGYNPTHDLCRMIIGAALEIIRRRTNHSISNFDFELAKGPTNCPAALKAKALRLVLTDDQLKYTILVFKRDCPQVADQTDLSNPRFRTEWLRPCHNRAGYDPLPENPPFYERHGEKRMAAGYYKEVIRYRRHIAPIAEALWDFVEKTEGSFENLNYK